MESSNKPSVSESKAVHFVQIQDIIGHFGKYQFFLCILVFISKFGIAFNQLAIVFLAPTTNYNCTSRDGTYSYNTCPCEKPKYDTSIFTRTIVMEWDLICDRKWLRNFSQSSFQFGTLVGSIIFGMASDRYGRKYSCLVAVIIQIGAGVAAAFMPTFWAFTVCRILIGVSVGGTMVITFVIIMEFIGTKYREIISACYQMPFNVGLMLLPLIANYNRNIIRHFQLAISIPMSIMLFYFCFLPETPRWLIAVGKTEKAITILESVAKVNKLPTANIRSDVQAYEESIKNQHKKGNIFDLFRTPNIRKNIIIMSLIWLSCSYCFYGVCQYVGTFSGNIFINLSLGFTISLFGSFLSIPLMIYVKRRLVIVVLNFISASCLFLLAIIPSSGIMSVLIACVGEVASFTIFVVVYLYCSELFPTVVRNAAIGFSSMMARVGSMIAPVTIGLRDVGEWLPPLLFGIIPLIAGFAAMFLPETKGCDLMTTIAEAEQFGKRDKSESSNPSGVKV